MSSGRIETAFPLTPLQEGMVLHTLRHPEAAVYRGQCVTTLTGVLDEDRLMRAWQHLIRRHQAFRSFFAWEGREKPLQVVREAVELPWRSLDWSERSREEQAEAWIELLEDDQQEPFDLTVAPLMRVVLVRLGEEEHRLLWSVHHALADGWSGFLVFREMVQLYEELARGPAIERPIPPSFATFVTWLEERDAVAAERFWRGTLEGVVDATRLELSGKGASSPNRRRERRTLARELSARFLAASHDLGVTPNTVVLAAWALVLARHQFDASDVVFGVTTSERPAEIRGVSESVGLYVSTVPVRIPMDDQQTVAAWLASIQSRVLDARHHSAGGLADIARWSELGPGAGLAHSSVVYESFPADVVRPPEEASLSVSGTEITAPSDLPLALLVFPDEDVRLCLEYDPSAYGRADVLRLLEYVEGVLDVLTANETAVVGDVLLTEVPVTPRGQEADRLPATRDVLDRFEAVASRRPDAVAIRDSDRVLTYRQLDRAANQRARTILAADRTKGLLAIPADRDASTVVSVLAALKAGVGYTLVDAEQPESRRHQMLAHVDAVLTSSRDERWSSRIVPVEDDSDRSTEKPGVSAGSDGVAYVVWTSGSTGDPKGVVVERGHLARSTEARLEYYADRDMQTFLLLSSMAVDSSVAGLFGTLCSGGQLVLPAARAEQDVFGLARLIEEAGVSATLLVPSLYRALLDSSRGVGLTSLRTVVVAGEACPEELLPIHRSCLPDTALFNEYGPSEATVWATAVELTHAREVTIGRPVRYVTTHVLDARGRRMPPGSAGEICIGGRTVARGYLADPLRTNDRFVPDPFVPGGRMYRTGDRGRIDAEGHLRFLGRIDDQIKLRGFRVEPGEIEVALASHPDVREVGVCLRGEGAGRGAQLTALFVSDGATPTTAELRGHLRTRVPAYMVPTRYHAVSALPRTSAGKLDRRTLESLVPSEGGATGSGPRPVSEVERAWARIWEEVLGIEEVGVDDDFFRIGGDSLLSIRVIARAVQAGLAVTPASFFNGPTIAQLAAMTGVASPEAEQGPVTGSAPLSPIQGWFIRTVTEGRDWWNQSQLWEVPPWVDADMARTALMGLVAHHDALRLTIRERAGRTVQEIAPLPADVTLEEVDVDAGDEPEKVAAATERGHRSLRIDEGPLVCAALLRGPDELRRLLFVAHHLVVDAVSWGILEEDFRVLLEQARADGCCRLPAKTTSVLAWTEALSGMATRLGTDVAHLADPAGVFEPISNLEGDARRTSVVFDEVETSHLLDVVGPKLDARPEALVLGSLLLAWRRVTGRDDLLVAVEGHGRDVAELDVSRTVGWFSVTTPLQLHLERDSIERAVAVARAALGSVSGRRGVHGLIRYMHPDEDVRAAAAVDPPVLFNYLSVVGDASADWNAQALARGSDGLSRSPDAPRGYVVDVNARIQHGRLTVDVDAPVGLRTASGSVDFPAAIRRAIEALSRGARDDGPRLDLAGLGDAGLARVADMLRELDDG